MSIPIGIGPFFSLGDWETDCATGTSVVHPPPINPITNEPPNLIGFKVGIGGGVVQWIIDAFRSAPSGETATTKLNESLQGRNFTGFLRGHLWAKGGVTPCVDGKRTLFWKWYISVTLYFGVDAPMIGAGGFVTLQLGPFDGGEQDPKCDCVPGKNPAALGQSQLHKVDGLLVAVRTDRPGTPLISDGVAYPALAIAPPATSDAQFEFLGASPLRPSDPPSAYLVQGDSDGGPPEEDPSGPSPAGDARVVKAVGQLKVAVGALEAALTKSTG